MALIEINLEGSLTFLESDETYGRRDEVYLRVQATRGAEPRVRQASRGFNRHVLWDLHVPRLSRSEFTFRLQEQEVYEVTTYPRRQTRWFHVMPSGGGSLARASVFELLRLADAEANYLAVLQFRERGGGPVPVRGIPLFESRPVQGAPRSPPLREFSKKGPPTKNSPAASRFDRILNESQEWDEKFKVWRDAQPIEEVIEKEMTLLEEENKKALDAKAKLTAFAKTSGLSDQDLSKILDDVLNGR